MDFIKQLQFNSLVNRVVTELDNHLGMKDKELAEFIISLAEEASAVSDFKEALTSTGAEMGDQLIETLWNLIKKLDPKKLVSVVGSQPGTAPAKPAAPSALSMPNDSSSAFAPSAPIKDEKYVAFHDGTILVF